jgi:hypothetical protein
MASASARQSTRARKRRADSAGERIGLKGREGTIRFYEPLGLQGELEAHAHRRAAPASEAFAALALEQV